LKQLRERLGELGFSALEIWCSEDIAATVAGSQLDLMRRDLFRAEHRPDERAETIVLQKLNAVGGRAELAKCSGDFRAVVYSLIIKGKVRFCGPTLPYRQVELVGDARATIAFEPKFDLREEEYNPDALPATSVKTLFVRSVGDETTLIRALLGKKAKNASAAPSTSLPKRSAEMKSQRELSLQVIVATPKRGAAPFWERVQKEIANIERLLSGQGKLAYPLKAAPSIRNLKRWRKLYREIGPAASIPGYNRDSREGEAWRSEGGLKIDRALRQHMKRAPCL